MDTNPVIIIPSCNRDADRNEVLRQSWIKEWKNQIPYKFIVGDQYTIGNLEDEHRVDEPSPGLPKTVRRYVPDGFEFLPRKVYAGFIWAYEHGYTHIFKCDTDTWVNIPNLLNSNFTRAHYIGYVDPGIKTKRFAHGGPGYWIDRYAVEQLLKTWPPTAGNEDEWIGQALSEFGGISCAHDERYTPTIESARTMKDSVISIHLNHGVFAVRDAHQEMTGKDCIIQFPRLI